ncbi:hypothetical protein RB195_015206 [Necator americanus]|uniref:Uncharacterized protein n=1 Tax=Necator americanus TaxID=51031 RepID=A0ABR1E3G8_NECAM
MITDSFGAELRPPGGEESPKVIFEMVTIIVALLFQVMLKRSEEVVFARGQIWAVRDNGVQPVESAAFGEQLSADVQASLIYWPHSLILGTELPSFGIILISCERLCAVLRPAAYNRIFMGKFKVALLLTVPLAGIYKHE